jgi:sugar transferase (PEP-CTERM/EpsH1 system associated)
MKRLLFLVHRIPYPPTKGDKVRSYNLLKYLVGRYRVHLGAFVDDAADMEHAPALRELCEECHLVRLNPALARVKSLLGLATGEALTLPYYRSASMSRWVQQVMGTTPVDGVLVFSSAMAQYAMSATHVPRVADLVDVDSDKWRQYAATQPWPYSVIYRRESRALLRYEREIARGFDATVFVSAAEAALFRQLAPEAADKVWHVNNGVDADYFSPERAYANPYGDSQRVLVFSGAMDYWPNVDAVVSFARDVFPAIRRGLPDARFYIVGARPAADVAKLAELPGVSVTGAVPDMRPYLAHAKLAVAPLRMARGVQNKVLEAMAMAKPVLASPQAAEGIEANLGSELLVAGDEAAFVRQAIRLLEHDDVAAIGAAARARVLASYAWKTSLSRFEQLLAPGSGIAGDHIATRDDVQPACATSGARS